MNLKTESKKTTVKPASYLEFLIESSNDAIILSSTDLLITYWNPAAERLYGYQPTEAIGQHLNLIIPQSRRGEFKKLHNRLIRGKNVKNLETQRLKKNGQVVDVSITISAMKDKKGKVIGFSSISHDNTNHRKFEERLKLLSAAVENSPDGIQITDLEGYILYSNPAIKTIYGFSSKEYQGKHVNKMNTDPEFASKIIIPAIKKSGKWEGELMVKHKNGRIFPIWLKTALVKNNRGKPFAIIGVVRDISKQKRMEEIKKDFLSAAAH